MGLAIMAAAFCVPGEAPAAPAVVLDRYFEAYNTRDFDGMRSVFTADAWIGWYPDKRSTDGAGLMEAYKGGTFEVMPDVKLSLLQRDERNGVVTQRERITTGGKDSDGLSYYKVDGGCITRMEIVSEPTP